MIPIVYDHTQPGGVTRIALGGGALGAAAVSGFQHFVLGLPWRLAAGPALVATVLGLAAVAFSSLTVRVDASDLHLWFGPGWLRRSIPLRDIASARAVRNTWCHGWGIHRMRRGWVFNVSGFDAMELKLRDGQLIRIGTDDPGGLELALAGALSRVCGPAGNDSAHRRPSTRL